MPTFIIWDSLILMPIPSFLILKVGKSNSGNGPMDEARFGIPHARPSESIRLVGPCMGLPAFHPFGNA